MQSAPSSPPYWSQGKEFNDAAGRMTLDKAAAQKGPAEMWLSLVDRGVMQKNIGEVRPADMVNAFKAGNLVAMVNWGFAWDQLQSQADSTVKGKVGVPPLPAMAGGKSATCIGGWQWAVSAFSKNKAASAKLVRYMSRPSQQSSSLSRVAAAGVRADLHRRRRVEEMPHYRDSLPVVQAAKGPSDV